MKQMSKESVKNLLSSMGPALRTNRLRVTAAIIQHPELFPDLLELVFDIEYKLHHKAAWTLELILERKLVWIVPHIDFFTESIHKLKHESAVRPVAKICKWISEAYVKKHLYDFVNFVKPIHIERIVETGFDWMITDTKVATKAYTMDTLYYFGSLDIDGFEWVHSELKNLIQQNSAKESSAYIAHAKQILKLLN